MQGFTSLLPALAPASILGTQAPSVLNAAKGYAAFSASETSDPINSTTGSTFVLFLVLNQGAAPTIPPDSQGNSYTQRVFQTMNSGTAAIALYVCENGAGGAGHTVTVNVGGNQNFAGYFLELSPCTFQAATAVVDIFSNTQTLPNLSTINKDLALAFIGSITGVDATVTERFGNIVASIINGATAGTLGAVAARRQPGSEIIGNVFTWTAGSTMFSGGIIATFRASSSGSAVNLAATAAAQATAAAALQKTASLAAAAAANAAATADLSTGAQANLAATAQGNASATAAISQTVPLGAAALGVASATGELAHTVPLGATAQGNATASANLGHGVPLSAAAAAIASAAGQLAVSVTLSGAALGSAAAAAQASVGKPLAAAAQGNASATGDLSVVAGGSVSLAAAAQGNASAQAALLLTVPLGAAAQGRALAGASLQLLVPLGANAIAQAQAAGSLTLTVVLGAAAQGNASASATLPAVVSLAAGAQALASVSAELRVLPGWVAAGPRELRGFAVVMAVRMPRTSGLRPARVVDATRTNAAGGAARPARVQSSNRRR